VLRQHRTGVYAGRRTCWSSVWLLARFVVRVCMRSRVWCPQKSANWRRLHPRLRGDAVGATGCPFARRRPGDPMRLKWGAAVMLVTIMDAQAAMTTCSASGVPSALLGSLSSNGMASRRSNSPAMTASIARNTAA